MNRDTIDSKEKMDKYLQIMIKRGYIVIEQKESKEGYKEVIKITKQGEYAIKFLSSLLLPFIESYWVALTFFVNMNPLRILT